MLDEMSESISIIKENDSALDQISELNKSGRIRSGSIESTEAIVERSKEEAVILLSSNAEEKTKETDLKKTV